MWLSLRPQISGLNNCTWPAINYVLRGCEGDEKGHDHMERKVYSVKGYPTQNLLSTKYLNSGLKGEFMWNTPEVLMGLYSDCFVFNY